MRKIVQCSISVSAALAILVSGVPLSASSQGEDAVEVLQAPAWRPVDAATGQIVELSELEALARDFPNSSSVRLRLLNAHLGADDMASALQDIRWLYEGGYVLSEGAQGQLLGMYEGEEAEELAVLFASAADPLATSEVVATIPGEAGLVEGVAVLSPDILLASSVTGRTVWTGMAEDWFPLSIIGEGNISGILADEEGMLLASGDLGMSPAGEEVFSGLMAFTEDAYAQPFPAPEGAQLSDIAGDAAQNIYASDPLGGGVYRLRSGEHDIETLVTPGTLRSPQGIAPSEDGSRLYISDYRYGLAMIDIASGEVSRLPADIPVLLDGIDGLWLHEGELIAVQNGVSPMRIVALALTEDGNRITEMRVLESANPEWTEPLGGSIYDGALYYVGNGQWDKFEEGGVLKEGAELVPTQIRRIELGETNP